MRLPESVIPFRPRKNTFFDNFLWLSHRPLLTKLYFIIPYGPWLYIKLEKRKSCRDYHLTQELLRGAAHELHLARVHVVHGALDLHLAAPDPLLGCCFLELQVSCHNFCLRSLRILCVCIICIYIYASISPSGQ